MNNEQILGFFVPKDRDYAGLKRALLEFCATGASQVDAGRVERGDAGICIYDSVDAGGGFKEAYRGTYCGRSFAVLAFTHEIGESGRIKALSSTKEVELNKLLRRRKAEYDSLVRVERLDIAARPYMEGTFTPFDRMGERYPAIAEELIEAPTLRECFKSGGLGNLRIGMDESSTIVTDLDSIGAASIVLDLARLVARLHDEFHAAHRDVKPGNFTYDAATRTPRLLDWGSFAERSDNPSDITHTVSYSLGFTAPERNPVNASWLNERQRDWRNRQEITRSPQLDVYSLGAMLSYFRTWFLFECNDEGLTRWDTHGRDEEWCFHGWHEAITRDHTRDSGTARPPFNLVQALEVLNVTPSTDDERLASIIMDATRPNPDDRITTEKLIGRLEEFVNRVDETDVVDGSGYDSLLSEPVALRQGQEEQIDIASIFKLEKKTNRAKGRPAHLRDTTIVEEVPRVNQRMTYSSDLVSLFPFTFSIPRANEWPELIKHYALSYSRMRSIQLGLRYSTTMGERQIIDHYVHGRPVFLLVLGATVYELERVEGSPSLDVAIDQVLDREGWNSAFASRRPFAEGGMRGQVVFKDNDVLSWYHLVAGTNTSVISLNLSGGSPEECRWVFEQMVSSIRTWDGLPVAGRFVSPDVRFSEDGSGPCAVAIRGPFRWTERARQELAKLEVDETICREQISADYPYVVAADISYSSARSIREELQAKVPDAHITCIGEQGRR